jgi:hypothetical protein
MKRRKAPTLPNYIRKLRYLVSLGALPRGVAEHHVAVYHDGWCGIFAGKR